MRSIRCNLFEREAARLAVTSGEPSASLAQHLERCESCRTAAIEYSRLATTLSGLPIQPSPSSVNEEQAWVCMQSVPMHRPVLVRGLTLAAAGASVLAIAIIFTRPRPASRPSGEPDILLSGKYDVTAKANGDKNQKVAVIPSDTNRTHAMRSDHSKKRSVSQHKQRAHTRRSASNHRIRRIHRPLQMMASKPPHLNPHGGQSNTAAAPQTNWATVGAYYEYYGDYRSAAAAYDRALDSAPTPALLYQAGRAAEYSGDVESAVEHLSKLLMRSTKNKNPEERGSIPWTEKPHSA